jgi:hypothetical protein
MTKVTDVKSLRINLGNLENINKLDDLVVLLKTIDVGSKACQQNIQSIDDNNGGRIKL